MITILGARTTVSVWCCSRNGEMSAKPVKNRKTGYYEIGQQISSMNNELDLQGDGEYVPSACLPACCSQCRRPFTLSDLTTWRNYIVSSPIIGFNGERSFNAAWEAVFNDHDCPRSCCRKEFLTFEPEDVWAELYHGANKVLPPDWTFDIYVNVQNQYTANNSHNGVVTKFGTTASAGFYNMQRAKAHGIVIDT